VSRALTFGIAVVLIIADQVLKLSVKGFSFAGITHEGMTLGESIPVIGEFVRWTFVENPGMAFGISWGAGKIILTLLTIVIASALAWYLWTMSSSERRLTRISMMLIFSGAVGNLIDRMFYGVAYGYAPLMYGKVVDFVQVDIPDVTWLGELYTHYPVFNLADSCVSVGIVLMLIVSLRTPGGSVLSTPDAPSDDNRPATS
jgi:signal peptidase II